MKPTRKVSRRSFLSTVGGGVAAAGALGLIAPGPARAFQCSDSDTGRYGDPGGQGRRCGRRRTGCTDNDAGAGSDPANYGTCRSVSGCSDSDSGTYADPGGDGRRCGCSDSDSGNYADPVGRGVRC